MPDNYDWESPGNKTIKETLYSNITEQGVSIGQVASFDYTQDVSVLLPQLDKPIFEPIDVINNMNTFQGKYSYFYHESEIASYNKETKIYNNGKIVDPIRKEGKFNIIFDESSGKFVNPTEVSYLGKISCQILPTEFEDGYPTNKIKLFADKRHPDFTTSGIYDSKKWENYVNSQILNKSFVSWNIKMDSPYNKDAIRDKNIKLENYVDLDPVYNYYNEEFETIFSKYPEIKSSNLYTIIDAIEWLAQNEVNITIEQGEEWYPSPVTNIFNNVEMNDKHLEKIIFSTLHYRDYIKKSKELRKTFPMYVETKIASNSEQILQHFFENIDLTQLIPQNYNLASDDYNFKMYNFIYEVDQTFGFDRFKKQELQNVKIVPLFSAAAEDEDQNYYNILSQLESIEDETIFGKKQMFEDFGGILEESIKEKIKEEYQKRARNIADIYAGKSCYSEKILYRIAKFDKNGQKIQDIYIPNISKQELSYIDTQIRYNKDYIYKISCYSMVFGECYSYFLDDSAEIGVDDVFLKAVIYPSIVIIETPYYEEEVFVVDAPPIFPLADFYSYNNQIGKILINFGQNSGKFKDEPLPFNDIEGKQLNRIKQFQNKKKFEDIVYNSDDPITKIQIFRTEVAPKNYLDFRFARSGILEDATSFIDFIEPNKKYYYSFRSFDIHNNFSNMSPIYEVKLTSYNGISYLDIKLYKFEESKQEKSKFFRRFLYIDGSLQQTAINFEKSNLKYIDPEGDETEGKLASEMQYSPVLGESQEDSIFGNKYFKMRIRSVNSGKTFDILLNFNTAHIKE